MPSRNNLDFWVDSSKKKERLRLRLRLFKNDLAKGEEKGGITWERAVVLRDQICKGGGRWVDCSINTKKRDQRRVERELAGDICLQLPLADDSRQGTNPSLWVYRCSDILAN